MKLGYFDFNLDYSIGPDDLARACEESGDDSLGVSRGHYRSPSLPRMTRTSPSYTGN
jgi:hypothetical protein